ncbi:MAG: cache domain-containing protein [Calditrichaeota bacterium]|nr:cache domain-containing protein [Calditrichota bacterium]
MADKKSRTGRTNPFLFSVLVLLIPLSLYYFVYIPHQRDYFTSRTFRLLGDMSKQIKSKVENYETILSNAAAITEFDLENYFRGKENSEQTLNKKLLDALNLVKGLKLRYLKIRVGDTEPGQSYYAAVFDSLSRGGVYSAISGAKFGNTQIGIEMEGESFWVNFFSKFYFHDASRLKELQAYTVYLHARIKLRDIVGSIFDREEFDHILLADNLGRVILQQNPKELLATRLDSLLTTNEKHRSYQSLLRHSQMLDVDIAGTNFKMFTQPVSISFANVLNGSERADSILDLHKRNNLQWTVCGLVESSRLSSQARTISYTYVLCFVSSFLLAVLLLPLIRLWYMGPKEKLRRGGVLTLIVSSILLTAFITFILLDITEYNHATGVVDRQLENFCRQIETRFRNELIAAHKQLRDASAEMLKDLQDGGAGRVTDVLSKNPEFLQTYPYFDMIVLVDSTGQQRMKWSVKKVPTPLINVASRPYFRDAKAGRLISLDEDTRFALQPIFSMNTGENLAVVAIPVESTSYVAIMTTRFLSLNSPVMPRGFGFAIIDKNGDVLFHSDERRNLRENFIEECDRDPKLRSAAFARVGKLLNANYQGRGHKLYVHPLADFHWIVIGFRDQLILRTANLELMSESVILFVLYVLIFLAVILLFYTFRPDYWADWLFPDDEKRASYLHLALVYALQCIVFFVWIFLYDAYQVLHTVFFLPPLAMLLAYLELKKRERQRRTQVVVLLILVVGTMLSGTIILSGEEFFSSFLRFLLLLVALAAIFATFFTARTRGIFERLGFISYRQAYVLVTVVLMLMVGIVPAVVFHKFAFDEEVQLTVKHRQLSFYRDLQERARRVRNAYDALAVENKHTFLERRLALPAKFNYSDVYTYAQTDRIFFEESDEHTCGDLWNGSRYWFERMLVSLRPLRNEISVETRELIQGGAADFAWCWAASGDTLTFHTEGMHHGEELQGASHADYGHHGKELHITSLLIDFRPHQSWLWWLCISFVIALLFPFVRFIARRIFLLDLEEPTDLYQAEVFLSKITKNLLVLGPPASGKSKILTAGNGKRKAIYELYDLALYPSPEMLPGEKEIKDIPEGKVVAIDHFEHRVDDRKWNYAKFQLLRNLLYSHKRTVVVISTIDPLFYFRDDDDEKKGAVDGDGQFVGMDDWAMVFSAFLKVYYEDKGDEKNFATDLRRSRRSTPNGRDNKDELYRFLEHESYHSSHLKGIAIAISELESFPQMSREELLAQFHEWAAGYYRAIWATCSREEKLVLSHLARYGFVNARNPELVRRLLRRRLIKRCRVFKLMNESFKRFVLSPRIQEEVEAWEYTVGVSSWGKLKVPLFTILIGAGLFVLVTQQEAFNTTLAVLSALAAAVPALVRLFGMFSSGEVKA